jgi:hypothetical protein
LECGLRTTKLCEVVLRSDEELFVKLYSNNYSCLRQAGVQFLTADSPPAEGPPAEGMAWHVVDKN